MENYPEFAHLCLSKLQNNKEEEEKSRRPSSASSLIRFYGRPILPPVLSMKQKEEMKLLRDEAQKATANKKDDPRMSYVQTILHSVQLRKAPTLQGLLQETEAESSDPCDKGWFSASRSDGSFGTRDSVSPGTDETIKDGTFQPPNTSLTCSAFSLSNMSPYQHKGYLTNQPDSQRQSQPCFFNAVAHQSLSSGYVTCENQEKSTVVAKERGDIGGFFLHSTSNTIAKIPDIISHPPIDGEELERTGVESFLCTTIMGMKDLCSTSFHVDSVRCDPLRAEQPEISPTHSPNKEVNNQFPAELNPARNGSPERNDGSTGLSEEKELSDDPDLQQTLNLLVQETPRKEAAEPADTQTDTADLKKQGESRPPSLQALLKKSQEYRRRQRMLRNQAKNGKILQERTQEQPKARMDEPSLSDKENDEVRHRGAVTVEGQKSAEGRSWKTNTSQCEVTEGKNVTEDWKIMDYSSIDEEITLRNMMNSSPEVVVTPKEMGVLVQQQSLSISSFHVGVGKYSCVPAPSFCLSPVPCKGKAVDGAGTSEHKLDTATDFNEISVKELNLDLAVEHDAKNVFAKSSLHIDQLESNLCSLKELISDLENTVKENLDDRQPSAESLESSKDSGRDNSSGCLEDTRDDAGDGNKVNDLCQKQSFIQFKNMDKDLRAHVTLTEQNKGSKIIKQSKVNVSTTGRRNETSSEGAGSPSTQPGICKKEQVPSESTTSVGQQMRTPSVFRNVAFRTFAPGFLSDLDDQRVERTGNKADEAEGPVASPSLNQSYDVDTPSDLWFQEESGSDHGSQGSHGRVKHLASESGTEDPVGVSKVKRRLHMHVSEDTQERHGGTGRAEDSVVRPSSSTPKAAVHLSGDGGVQTEEPLKNKQEQLRQIHAAQLRALQEEHRRQQEELLQVLAARYRLLQDVSPCSTSASRFGDTVTFSSLSQPLSPHSLRCLPLLVAAVKGFLTRRLLRAERVAQLVRTIRDTRQFLQAFQQQSTSRGERCSRQDVLLQERVALQLRAARYEVYDIFFGLSAGEQMQLIRWDRDLDRERRLRRQNEHACYSRGKSSLSAATQKSLERKRERMIQKRATEHHRGATVCAGQKSGVSAEKPQETKRAQFKANPQRVPKSVCSSKPR